MIKNLLSKILGTPAQRYAAQEEIEVYIAPNEFGGWSIYPANEAAGTLFAGTSGAGTDGVGNFGLKASAVDRAAKHNCWTVVDQPAWTAILKPVAERCHTFRAPELNLPPRRRDTKPGSSPHLRASVAHKS